jgi:hypothetical protein
VTAKPRPRRPASRPRLPLPLRPLQLPAEPGPQDGQDGVAAIYAWLHRAVVDDVPPAPLDAEMAANLATLLLVVLTENVRHQTGLAPDQARAAAVGWIAAKAQGVN